MRNLIESFTEDPIMGFLIMLLVSSLIIFPMGAILIIVRDYL